MFNPNPNPNPNLRSIKSGYHLRMRSYGIELKTTHFLQPDPNTRYYQILRDIGCSFIINKDYVSSYDDNTMHLFLGEQQVATFEINEGYRDPGNKMFIFNKVQQGVRYVLNFFVFTRSDGGGLQDNQLFICCPNMTITLENDQTDQ
jgi:hypothetical protein